MQRLPQHGDMCKQDTTAHHWVDGVLQLPRVRRIRWPEGRPKTLPDRVPWCRQLLSYGRLPGRGDGRRQTLGGDAALVSTPAGALDATQDPQPDRRATRRVAARLQLRGFPDECATTPERQTFETTYPGVCAGYPTGTLWRAKWHATPSRSTSPLRAARRPR